MKHVLELSKVITNSKYFDGQFKNKGNKKNILFVAPQLSSRHLYNFILPFFSFFNEDVFPAVTSLTKFSPYEQIVRLDVVLNAKELKWADFVVIPFTTQDLSKEFGVYEAIREVNPNIQIVFYVDFNFYEIPKSNHHYQLFQFPEILPALERNILKCDLCLTTNEELDNYMYNKFNELMETTYASEESILVNFSYIPIFIDEEIVTQNIDFDAEKPKPVINRKVTIKVAKVAEKIKKKDLKSNKTKAAKLKSSKSTPKPETTKAIKVKAKDDKPEIVPPAPETKKDVVWDEKAAAPVIAEVPKVEIKKLDRPYKMGVIVTQNNMQDIVAFKSEFLKINQKYPDINIVLFGYDYKSDKDKLFKGLEFEYVPPVSIIHYFKQLKSFEFDFVVIPLLRNKFNLTSENLNKYFECAIFEIPVIAPDFFPYSKYISEKLNGYLYKNKVDLLSTIDDVLTNTELIKHIGKKAKDDVLRNHSFSEANIEALSQVYDEKQEE